MKFVWRQKLGRPECPYIERTYFECKWFSVRLHHWLASDDQRFAHNHPWQWFTLVLAGSYTDVTDKGNQRMIPGRFAFRSADHCHKVKVDKGGCWTLLITGPEKKEWGFFVNGKFRRRNKYFFEWGHHPCEN
jgi:hypothetical protein